MAARTDRGGVDGSVVAARDVATGSAAGADGSVGGAIRTHGVVAAHVWYSGEPWPSDGGKARRRGARAAGEREAQRRRGRVGREDRRRLGLRKRGS